MSSDPIRVPVAVRQASGRKVAVRHEGEWRAVPRTTPPVLYDPPARWERSYLALISKRRQREMRAALVCMAVLVVAALLILGVGTGFIVW